jgi:hypothetical protein
VENTITNTFYSLKGHFLAFSAFFFWEISYFDLYDTQTEVNVNCMRSNLDAKNRDKLWKWFIPHRKRGQFQLQKMGDKILTKRDILSNEVIHPQFLMIYPPFSKIDPLRFKYSKTFEVARASERAKWMVKPFVFHKTMSILN